MIGRLKQSHFLWGIILALGFFVVGVGTLSHYGLNVDEPFHFTRGQAYLHFFLTGRASYTDSDFHGRVSFWKLKGYDASYFLTHDQRHPPLNGILAATVNKIFYEKLGLVGDLESYHLFEVFVSSLLVFFVYTMTARSYGVFAGIIATLALILYPLFLGESHYNIKDPVQASFFALTIFFFYLGVEKISARYFYLSSFFCALAFATKFNIIFLPFIILPYLIVRYLQSVYRRKKIFRELRKIAPAVYLSLILYPMIVFGVQFLTRPYLWADPIRRFSEVVQFYQYLGTGNQYQPASYYFFGWNTYPVIFIGASTPLVILVFFLIGVAGSLPTLLNKENKFTLLVFLWFLVPIVRASAPGFSIYGGVRQIMEYIPPMAILSGIGAKFLLEKYKNYAGLLQIAMLLMFLPVTLKMISLHPNEAVFMNMLVGGLKGAYKKQLPGAGETMGNVYLQGVQWLNRHAEQHAQVWLPVGLRSNIPFQFLRSDIKFGPYFTGTQRGGEYLMEKISVGFPPPLYTFQYADRYLIQVYAVQVDGVPLLKIWENDRANTKPGYLDEEEIEVTDIDFLNKNTLRVRLAKPSYLTRIEIVHNDADCTPQSDVVVRYQLDQNSEETRLSDTSFRTQGDWAESLQTSTRFVYLFPAIYARDIRVTALEENWCGLLIRNVKIYKLKEEGVLP